MTEIKRPFQSIYTHGFVRVATATPQIRIADPQSNARHTLELAEQAHDRHVGLVIFPAGVLIPQLYFFGRPSLFRRSKKRGSSTLSDESADGNGKEQSGEQQQ